MSENVTEDRAKPPIIEVATDDEDRLDQLNWGSLRDWAELVRLPNVFTVIADSLAAIILVHSLSPVDATVLPWVSGLLLVLASVLFYWGGMILNDVVDLAEDRESRAQRPLVRGRVSPVLAGHIGNALLLVAPIVVLLATNIQRQQPLWMGAAFLTAVGLSLCIRFYDSSLKQTLVGPFLMGGCRSLNILMAGFGILAVATGESLLPRPLIFMALGMGIYVVGITIFARREETTSLSSGLALGLLLQVAGLGIIAALPWLTGQQHSTRWQVDPFRAYPVLIGLVGFTVINRGFQAVSHPVSRKVQLAVKHAILTIILLDAAIAALSAGHWFGGGIALLLFPALIVGSKFRST